MMLLMVGANAQSLSSPRQESLSGPQQQSHQQQQSKPQSSSNDTKKIRSEIERMYKGAVISEIDKERDGYEVEIRHNRLKKTVHFNNSEQWVSTEYNVTILELPKRVSDEIKRSQYRSYKIDDIDFVETPRQRYYEIEFDRANRNDLKVRITAEGKFL